MLSDSARALTVKPISLGVHPTVIPPRTSLSLARRFFADSLIRIPSADQFLTRCSVFFPRAVVRFIQTTPTLDFQSLVPTANQTCRSTTYFACAATNSVRDLTYRCIDSHRQKMADYESLKVAELRELLKQRSIPSTGLTRKAQIIERLRENDAAKLAPKTDVNPTEHEPVVADEAQPTELPAEEAQIANDAAPPPVPEEPAFADEATVTVPSSTSDDTAEESKKRKRRSPTPPPAEKDIAVKKARLETKGVHLKEEFEVNSTQEPAIADVGTEETAVKTASTQPKAEEDKQDVELKHNENTTLPQAEESLISKPQEVKLVDGSKDDIRPKPDQDDTNTKLTEDTVTEEVDQSDNVKPAITEPPVTQKVEPITQSAPISSPTQTTTDSKAQSGYEPIHPPTNALYIRPFERPVNEAGLRNHLESVATGLDLLSPSNKVKLLYVDSIKSHAFVILNSEDSATRALVALNNSIWPSSDKWRKPLKVDYIPEDKAQAWTDIEKQADPRGGRNIRWEVVYKADANGQIKAYHGEENKVGNIDREPIVVEDTLSSKRDAVAAQQQQPPPQRQHTDTQGSFKTIDQLFSSIADVKPKIYFKEVAEALWRSRLRELRIHQSRRWDPLSVRVTDEFRRYTFRGDRLFDAGRHVQGPRALAREGLGGAAGRGGGRFGGGRRGGYGGGAQRMGYGGPRSDEGSRGYGAARLGDFAGRDRR